MSYDKMTTKSVVITLTLLAVAGATCWGQSFNATISGKVTDPAGATVPGAEVTLTAVDTGVTTRFTTPSDGLFRFPNLQRGGYELRVAASGFKEFLQKGITVSLNDSVRVEVELELGTSTQSVEVLANASPLNFESAEMKQAVRPDSLAQLPLIVSGNQRAVLNFVMLVPGVTGSLLGGASATMRINGGMRNAEEGVLDGVTMEQGLMSQGGQISMVNDYPITPEAVGEVSVLTSNFEPQYGSSNSGVMTATTKSGTSQFHGSVFWFLRNSALNARQFGTPTKSKDIEHDLGANVGGPVNVPGLRSASRRTYFFLAFGRWYARGATVSPTLSIPSARERQGDFSDWRDTSGKMIPIYDPATTRTNPSYNPNSAVGPSNLPFLRDQFMGCDGASPNVICPSDPRLKNSMANGWLKFLPTPTYATQLNNYVPPGYATMAGAPVDYKTSYDIRFDHYAGSKDHIAVNVHYHVPTFRKVSYLPGPLATERYITDGGSVGPWVERLNWDHTFTPTLLNNLNFGYLNFRGWNSNVADDYVAQLPAVSGVPSHKVVPALSFADFSSYGATNNNGESRPTYVVNDLATWIRGVHVLEFGGEYKYLTLTRGAETNIAGSFSFSRVGTGLPGVTSGNSMASFLLEQVDSASANFVTLKANTALSHDLSFHAGDTWKVTPKLSVNYGLRFDLSSPSEEQNDDFSFFDPYGANAGAGNRPGRLAFAGTKWGAASYGARYPEAVYYHAFAPRLGIALAVGPKTVVRSGYGIFYAKNFYYCCNGGMNLSGFNNTVSFSSSGSGLTPAFILSQGFPSNFRMPPFIDATYLNGQTAPLYRTLDGNRLPYTQQWNFTLERQLSANFYVNASYVGNKGTRLHSGNIALNALDPKYLSMGQKLNDQFKTGVTQLDGVNIPYAGWVEQMQACAPTVAQALLPYPQYCGVIRGVNQNNGNSTYHSFQWKAEQRQSHGVWLLFSYTLSKMIDDFDDIRATASAPMSPFERRRNKSLASDDVLHTLSVATTYDLPFGKGKRFLNHDRILDKVFGGWVLANMFRANSGTPFSFRSNQCNVPAQFAASCVPAVLGGANPWAQDTGNFNPNKPLFNSASFEPANAFNFYYGTGARVSNLRGFGLVNHDIAAMKNTKIMEKVSVQFRGEFFNIWNMHSFTSNFGTDVSSQTFGMWNGGVTAPRNVQAGLKVIF